MELKNAQVDKTLEEGFENFERVYKQAAKFNWGAREESHSTEWRFIQKIKIWRKKKERHIKSENSMNLLENLAESIRCAVSFTMIITTCDSITNIPKWSY